MKKNIFFPLLFVLAVIFAGCGGNKYDYQMSVEDTFAQGKQMDLLPVEKLAAIILSQDTLNYQFVDVRNPHRFQDGHVDGAINLPLKGLYNHNLDAFCEADKVFLVYGEDASQARMAVSYLRQLGFDNVIAVGGGYGFIRKNIIENYTVHSATYDDEVAKYDYAKIVATTAGASVDQSQTAAPAPAAVVPVKRKKTESVGGCE